MIALVAICLMCQSRSLYQRIFPQPTGNNGYEEYLMAADILSSREYTAFKAWRPGRPTSGGSVAPEGLSERTTPLGRMKYEVDHFGKALKLLSSGNAKPTSRGFKESGIEVQAFGDLTGLAIDSAYVAYAKGDWATGTTQLLDTLEFCDNTSKEGTFMLEASCGNANRVFASFDTQSSHWSIKDCDRIVKRTAEILARRTAIPIALDWDWETVRVPTQTMVSGELKLKAENAGGDVGRELIARLNALNASERVQLQGLVNERFTLFFGGWKDRFQKSETEWSTDSVLPEEPALKVPFGKMTDLARAICEDAIPPDERIVAGIRYRAQLRLLRLHARVQAYRWKNAHMPGQIVDAASRNEALDVLSGRLFHFEPTKEGGYRLFSEGTSRTGPIDLAMRQPETVSTSPP